jgi:mpaB/rubber oxygenase-like protein
MSVGRDELDEFRERTDDALDPLVIGLPPQQIGPMLGVLFRSDQIPESDSGLRALLDRLPPVAIAEPEAVAEGQELFRLFGPECLLILGCYSLPAAYAAAQGVQVIHRARRLEDDGIRRLTETAQMVVNLMVPGGLEPGGIGARSARKVRLMHALVRQHVRAMPRPAWSAAYGEPINQEDLAGTLLTFSLLVLDGLKKIGAVVSPAAEHGYYALWSHVGAMLGVDERLRPRTTDAAVALAARIGERQFRASPEGQHLARELIKVNDALFPVPGYGLSLMHFFLHTTPFGVDLAKVLDLPAPNWTRLLVRARAAQKRVALDWLPRVPGAERRRRALSGFFAQRLIALQRPDKISPFEVPQELWQRWRLRGRAASA